MTRWHEVPTAPGSLFESARWISAAGCFQWVDILESRIMRWVPGASDASDRVLDLDFVTCALPIDADRSIVSSRDTIYEYSWSAEVLTDRVRVPLSEGVRFNDGNFSPAGILHLGTMSMSGAVDEGALFAFDETFTPRSLISGVGISNGIVWPRPDLAAYVDSRAQTIELIRGLGEPGQRRQVLLNVSGSVEPDGLALSPEGALWVALWNDSCVAQMTGIDASTRLRVPGSRPTSLAFGQDLMFVTLAADNSPGDPPNGHAVWARRPSHVEGSLDSWI